MLFAELKNHCLKAISRRFFFLSVTIGAVSASVATIAVFGVVRGGDMTRYINRGGKLWDYYSGNDVVPAFDAWDILYFFPNIVLSGIHRLFPEFSKLITVGLNITLFTALVFFMLKAWYQNAVLRTNIVVVGAVLIIFFGMPGEITKYLGLHHSSDIAFLSLSGLALVYITQYSLSESRRSMAIAAAMASVALFTRPAGLVTLCAVVTGILFHASYPRSRGLLLAAIVIPGVLAFFAWPFYIQYLIESGSVVSKGMNYVLENYKEGAVVSGYIRSYVASPVDYLDYVLITVLRSIYYVFPLRSGYSFTHVLSNLLYLAFLMLLVSRGYRLFRRDPAFAANAPWILFIYVLWMALFHAMTQVEDWRYEMPLWPALWILAGYGVATDLRRSETPSTSQQL